MGIGSPRLLSRCSPWRFSHAEAPQPRGPTPRAERGGSGVAVCPPRPVVFLHLTAALHAAATGRDRVPRRDRGRGLCLARGRGEPRGASLEPRPERLHPRHARRAPRPHGHQGAAHGAPHLAVFAVLRSLRARGSVLRTQGSAPEAAAAPRRARVGGRSGGRADGYDPNVVDPSGKTAIDFFVPSRDGKRVAVSLSERGSESGDVTIFDVATGKPEGHPIPRVNGGTAGGSVAWNADGSGLFYTRYPHPGERPPADIDFYQQVYFHKVGTDPSADTYAIGKEFPRIAEIELLSSDDGRFTLARVANGDGGEFAFYLRGPRGAWTPVAQLSDRIVDARFGSDNGLYLISHAKKRGQVLHLSPATAPISKAEVVVPESDAVIASITLTSSRLFVVNRVGGPSQIRVFPLGKARLRTGDGTPSTGVQRVAGGTTVRRRGALS